MPKATSAWRPSVSTSRRSVVTSKACAVDDQRHRAVLDAGRHRLDAGRLRPLDHLLGRQASSRCRYRRRACPSARCAPRRRRRAPRRHRAFSSASTALQRRHRGTSSRRPTECSCIKPFIERADDAGGNAPDVPVAIGHVVEVPLTALPDRGCRAGDWPGPSGRTAAPRRPHRPRPDWAQIETAAAPPTSTGVMRKPVAGQIVRQPPDGLDERPRIEPDLLLRLAQGGRFRRADPRHRCRRPERRSGRNACAASAVRCVRITSRLAAVVDDRHQHRGILQLRMPSIRDSIVRIEQMIAVVAPGRPPRPRPSGPAPGGGNRRR